MTEHQRWLEERKNEEWSDIPGFEGLYAVNRIGQVKSRGISGKKGRVLKQYLDRYGYLKVVLYKDHKPNYRTVHRLVALTFIPNPENKETVNHIDNNRTNNFVENLEWATSLENLEHSFNQNRQSKNKTPIICTNVNSGTVLEFESQRLASRVLNLNQRHINNVLRNKNRMKTYKGWVFKYA